ncbi:glycosyltransferase family 2 [Lecanosticta acicola]|uniref:Glycosyltransferase family 2 n=1 Tax=Lecanosticta acicola TaxID=111012 RepID=A0AAI8Z3T5_9PEZI|nr:glycosyltransferase family 2 [Lecanosticta acicola]
MISTSTTSSDINTNFLSAAPAADSPSAMATTSAIFLALFFLVFTFRYLRTVVSMYSWNTYKPKAILKNPTYTSGDVSVIIPTTFKHPEELLACIRGILRCDPAKIFIVTADANCDRVKELLGLHSVGPKVEVLGVAKLNKRDQILRALPHITTDLITLADDDVFWPGADYLDHVLAIFEDSTVGAGGTRQRVKREENPGFWNILGISYLERRVWNNCATNAMDGSLSTLSGRTATYRSVILQDPRFQHYFKNDMWRGKPLNSDDDKCLTRYVYSHGWKIVLQFAPEATLETTVENDKGYLSQCMRWARAHWRGNFTVMENESYWLPSGHWWGFYYIYLGQFQTPALLWEGLLFGLLSMALRNASSTAASHAYAALCAWIFFTKNLKMIPYFLRHPADMKWIPVLVAFSYFHGLMNVYAAFSMQQTQWGGKDLKTLEKSRAEPGGVVPLLHDTMEKADGYHEPTPGNPMGGDDYFRSTTADKKDD